MGCVSLSLLPLRVKKAKEKLGKKSTILQDSLQDENISFYRGLDIF
jgi:hypothetical protein